jgi:hypothetical protein
MLLYFVQVLILVLLKMCLQVTITIHNIIYRIGFYLKHDVSETGFCLRLQVEPSQLGPIKWDPPDVGDRIQSPKHRVLNKRKYSG